MIIISKEKNFNIRHYTFVIRHLILFIILFTFFSCSRSNDNSEKTPALISWSGAAPMMFLQPGENPLWFQLTKDGPVHIDYIEDAEYSSPLVPWVLAPHIRYIEKQSGDLILVVNRIGFLKICSNAANVQGADSSGIAVYSFSGGEYFNKYSAGGFVFFISQPVVILYLDDRFLDTDETPPAPRAWTFNMNSNAVFPIDIPVLNLFPEEERWDIDTLRLADDTFFYYRAVNKKNTNRTVHMYRTGDLGELSKGTEISIDVFYNSAPRKKEINHPLLPALPEGFVYTGIETINGSLFASWEEQADYSIGAAGFTMIKPK